MFFSEGKGHSAKRICLGQGIGVQIDIGEGSEGISSTSDK